MNPANILISDYTYTLPDDKIARYPLAERDASKLLVYQNGAITDTCYRDIDQFLPAGSLLVFNNTKVVEARLLFQKPSGGVIELFCLEPHNSYPDITENSIRGYALANDWVDIKVCAVSELWSGLKLVIPLAKRQ